MDQHEHPAGPASSQSQEAPRRKRGAQPGNSNARKRAAALEGPKPESVSEPAPVKKRGPGRPRRTDPGAAHAAAVPPATVTKPDANVSKAENVTKEKKVRKVPDAKIDDIADGIQPAPAPKKRKKAKSLESLGRIKDGPGRPRSIEPTEENFRKVSMLAKLRCTELEASSAFECSEATFRRFLADNEKANEAWVAGAGNFCISLRRKQIQAADAGNVTMLIWLGKQFLGQRDKHEHSGDASNPIGIAHSIAPTTPKEAADAYVNLIRNHQ